jgi:hypothetical protein
MIFDGPGFDGPAFDDPALNGPGLRVAMVQTWTIAASGRVHDHAHGTIAVNFVKRLAIDSKMAPYIIKPHNIKPTLIYLTNSHHRTRTSLPKNKGATNATT